MCVRRVLALGVGPGSVRPGAVCWRQRCGVRGVDRGEELQAVLGGAHRARRLGHLAGKVPANEHKHIKTLGRDFLAELARDKPVVTCGDFNVAHEEIDLARPDDNHENAGFSDAERESFTKLLESGLVDTFRERHPDLAGAYSWWSYRMRARERGIGWRIDYFLVSPQLMPKVTGTAILDNVYGSDHCPIELELEL